MREIRVETRLRDKVKKHGGLALKWVSPGWNGAPDRIVLSSDGRVVFVELKAPGRVTTPLQANRLDTLQSMGFEVRVLSTLEMVDAFIAEFFD